MAGLRIVTSNRLEVLSEALAGTVREPLISPLSPEIIMVQSGGMQRWISLELARYNGIFANGSFPFPNAFLQNIFRILLPDMPDVSPFDPDIMTFKVMEFLPSLIEKADFEILKQYLSDDPNQLKRYQLSEKIADLFDQYLVFRPEMMIQWEAGKANHWQAQLWRALCGDHRQLHRARLWQRAREMLRKPLPRDVPLPERVSIFGISYLPPFHLQFLAEMANHTQINFFLMNPCREYWADIVTNRELRKIRDQYASSEEPLHLVQGNRLIASMGVHGRDFFQLLQEFDCEIEEHFPQLEIDHTDDLLSRVQNDILNLVDTQSPSASTSGSRQAIQVHVCHSPMREIEVLHDTLLSILEAHSGLMPKDIFVLTPDIEKYAPYIHAVFDSQTDAAVRLPYSVADQGIKKESLIIGTFMSFLGLKGSRMGAAQVMGLLVIPLIREHFDLSESEIETIHRWVKDTHIRWGIDRAHRRQMGLPGLRDNTWRSGIDRLLLGYAMPGGNSRLYEGILPYDPIEGEDGKTLGKFLEFLDRLFTAYDDLHKHCTLGEWHTLLNGILDGFFHVNDDLERESQVLRNALDALIPKSEVAFSEKVGLEMVSSLLSRYLDQETLGYGFISGGITFCAMLPMRSIPVKVICLIGMDSDAFPRKTTSVGFDLLARYPKRGDRSRRNDDRYLFLEALLSARETLYISYVGRSIQDNSVIPPSSLVSELLDYISDAYGVSESEMVVHHRLQAFSHRYFLEDDGNNRLFSYSKENLIAAASVDDQIAPPAFISETLETAPDEWKSLTANGLCNFISNPARYFLETRLGIFLRRSASGLDDTENFSLDGLKRYQIGRDLVHSFRAGTDFHQNMEMQKAMGELPHGTPGDVAYREMGVDAERFAEWIDSQTRGHRLDDREVILDIDGFHLNGRLSDLYDTGQIRIRYGNKKPSDMLTAWVYHLILRQIGATDLPTHTILLCKDSMLAFGPVENAQTLLKSLLDTYWVGLSEPISFFPESSYTYALNILEKRQDPKKALQAAARKWVGSDFSRGESEDPHYALCFNHTDPIDDRFGGIALDIFEPLLGNCTEKPV